MLDLILAIVHHVLMFAIFGILFAEFMALAGGYEQCHRGSSRINRLVVRRSRRRDPGDRLLPGDICGQGLGLLFA